MLDLVNKALNVDDNEGREDVVGLAELDADLVPVLVRVLRMGAAAKLRIIGFTSSLNVNIVH